MWGRRQSRSLRHGEREEVWRLYRLGLPLRAIGRELGRDSSSVTAMVNRRGGVSPGMARRRACALTSCDRERISRGLASGDSLRAIARALDRPPSTISREVRRNGGREKYRALFADERAWERAQRPKVCRLSASPVLRDEVASLLRLKWSPSQIAGWLKLAYPDQPERQVSHETIYRTLFIQSRGAFNKELTTFLRSQRTVRRAKAANRAPPGRGQIKGAVSIRERPAEADDRAVPGHWEGDLIFGARKSYVGTLVERSSRFVMLIKLDGKDTHTVVDALARHMQRLPATLKRSLTWDRGSEIAAHAKFTMATDIRVYLCDPKSPWQRGSNENTNGLLRQYLPRNTDINLSQDELDAIALELNQRPRQTLGFRTPAFKLNEALQ